MLLPKKKPLDTYIPTKQSIRSLLHKIIVFNNQYIFLTQMDLSPLLDITTLSQAFSSNVYVSALVMILMNVGTSYLMQDLMPIAHRIFSVLWVRRLVFFAIFFTATRDLKVSILLMIVFTLLVDLFLNENSEYCLIPYEHRLPQPHQPTQPVHAPAPPQQQAQQQHAHESRPTPTSTNEEHFSVQDSNRRQQQQPAHRLPPSYNVHNLRRDAFKRNAMRWSMSRRPVSYW